MAHITASCSGQYHLYGTARKRAAICTTSFSRYVLCRSAAEWRIIMYEEITAAAKAAAEEIIENANLSAGKILVIGCSSSEVCGDKIGTNSSVEIAESIFAGIYPVLK